VLNAAYHETQFWDGRSPDLEDQARHPFVNPVEMGLASHQPILDIIAADADYGRRFLEVFGVPGAEVEIEHVLKAIASFERTVISGDTPFDRYYYGRDDEALTDAQKRRVITKAGPVLRAVAQDERGQARNRELAIERLVARLAEALHVERRRVAARPTRAATEERSARLATSTAWGRYSMLCSLAGRRFRVPRRSTRC